MLARGKKQLKQAKARERAEAQKRADAKAAAKKQEAANQAKAEALGKVVTAHATANWNEVVAALRTLEQADILAAIGPFAGAELTAIGHLVSAAATRKDKLIHRCISFIQHGPAPSGQVTHAHVDTAGPGKTRTVDGGDIDVRTSSDITMGTNSISEVFSAAYTGADSANTRWLQFIWREIVVDTPTSLVPVRVGGSYQASGDLWELTTDPAQPKYGVDSGDGATPFYEVGYAHNRDATTIRIFDRPSSLRNLLAAQFNPPTSATKIVSRAHFDLYLVRGMDVLYGLKIDVEWDIPDAATETRTTKAGSMQVLHAIEPRQRQQLITEYPTFDYLP